MRAGILAALALAVPASAQVLEGPSIKPQADSMRKAWKASPAKPVAITVPLFGRVMSFDMMRNFVPAYQATGPNNFIFEFLPDGQSFDNWTQMVTITAARGLGADRRSDTELAAAALSSPQGCARGHFYRALAPRALGGGLSQLMVIKGCASTAANAYPGASPAIGEESVILVFRDRENVYSLQYATRAKFVGGRPPISDAAAPAAVAPFGTVRLCAPDATDAACKSILAVERKRAAGQ